MAHRSPSLLTPIIPGAHSLSAGTTQTPIFRLQRMPQTSHRLPWRRSCHRQLTRHLSTMAMSSSAWYVADGAARSRPLGGRLLAESLFSSNDFVYVDAPHVSSFPPCPLKVPPASYYPKLFSWIRLADHLVPCLQDLLSHCSTLFCIGVVCHFLRVGAGLGKLMCPPLLSRLTMQPIP